MPRFCPDNFRPLDKNIKWAMEKFRVSRDEVENQLEQMIDHEFKRDYTDWNRVFRNWMRTADKHNLLFRPYKPRVVEIVSDEQREIDARKAEENLKRLAEISLPKVPKAHD